MWFTPPSCVVLCLLPVLADGRAWVPSLASGKTASTNKTVLAWVEGNWTEVAEFVLTGAARGAVNAISAEGMWLLGSPSFYR